MKKIDARSLSPEAQEERRYQALRLREELQLTWKEIARVVGVHKYFIKRNRVIFCV